MTFLHAPPPECHSFMPARTRPEWLEWVGFPRVLESPKPPFLVWSPYGTSSPTPLGPCIHNIRPAHRPSFPSFSFCCLCCFLQALHFVAGTGIVAPLALAFLLSPTNHWPLPPPCCLPCPSSTLHLLRLCLLHPQSPPIPLVLTIGGASLITEPYYSGRAIRPCLPRQKSWIEYIHTDSGRGGIVHIPGAALAAATTNCTIPSTVLLRRALSHAHSI